MMKEKLLKVYQERYTDFKTIRATFPNGELSGALFMSPNEMYAQQPYPLLIIGQETFHWDHFEDLDKQMAFYEKFNVGKNYHASPFWNVTRKVEKALGNKEYSCAWTNISKFDVKGKRAFGEYETAISKLDDLLVTEIEILKPKVCLFFTGHSFDERIRKIFIDIEFIKVESYRQRQLCQLKHRDLPALTFRSYHPNYLRRSGKEDDFINFITSQIK